MSDTTDLLNVDNLGIKVIKNLLPFPFCLDKETRLSLKLCLQVKANKIWALTKPLCKHLSALGHSSVVLLVCAEFIS